MTNFDDFPLRSFSSYSEYAIDSKLHNEEKYVRGYYPIEINSDNVDTSTHQVHIILPRNGDIIERLYFDAPVECILKYAHRPNERNDIVLPELCSANSSNSREFEVLPKPAIVICKPPHSLLHDTKFLCVVN